MPAPIQQSQSQSRDDRAGAWMSNLAVPLLPILACFLGGATQKWAEGVVLCFLGLALVLWPPRVSLGLATNCVFMAFLAFTMTAFLPARWFFFPAWRSAVIDDFAIALPQTISAQPWITAGAFVSLIGGMSWLYLVSTQDIELRATRSQLRLFTGGVVFLAALSILFYLAHTALPFWINQRGFGPFPNRNQTADLFGIASIMVLACGQDDIRRGRKRWIIWLIGLGILVAGIILNFSRAGLAILVGGSVLWITTITLRKRSAPRLALAVSFLMLMLTAILLLGGQTLERFHLHKLGGAGVSTDFRWKIFHDAFELIHDSPWCGLGLGNFDAVFAIFRKESIGDTRALHPESDWIWLWSEAGLIPVLLTIVGAVLLIRRVLPLQEGTNQRFRLAALIGALIFAVHGLVDVSGHRVGTAFAGLFLLGLTLHRPLCLPASRLTPMLFRAVGILLIACGASWVVATQGQSLLPGAVGVSNIKQLAGIANRGRNFNETIDLTARALIWAPLDWQLYFSRALAEVGAKKPLNAIEDFRRARFLEPNAYEVPLAEGNAWLGLKPVLAATAWREALRRAGPQRAEVYSSMLTTASLKSPEVGRILEEVGLNQPDLALAYLGRLSGEPFRRGVTKLLQNDPDLQSLGDTGKLVLFDLWSERGDLDELAKTIARHPEWLRYAWLGVAKFHANKKDFKAAYELTQRLGEAVAMPRVSADQPLDQLRNRYVANPDNYGIGYALYRAQIQGGRIDDALNVARHFSERPGSPAYFHVLEAQCWASKQNWERAWLAWLAYRSAANK